MADFMQTVKDAILKMPSVMRNKAAGDWFKGKVSDAVSGIRIAKPEQNFSTAQNFAKTAEQKTIRAGDMFMFVYDAKHKATLPYYDTFPLIFPISVGKNSFIGLNLHYLNPSDRAQLFDKLLELRNNDKFDKTTKLKLSWQLVKNVSVLVEPTVHEYLFSQVRSKFIKVSPADWKWVVFLPFDNFVKGANKEKASRGQVWRDSKLKSKGKKP